MTEQEALMMDANVVRAIRALNAGEDVSDAECLRLLIERQVAGELELKRQEAELKSDMLAWASMSRGTPNRQRIAARALERSLAKAKDLGLDADALKAQYEEERERIAAVCRQSGADCARSGLPVDADLCEYYLEARLGGRGAEEGELALFREGYDAAKAIG